MALRLMPVVCGNFGGFVPLLVQRFGEMEYLILGLVTVAPCIVFPLLFGGTVGFFPPNSQTFFFVGHFFAHFDEMCSIHV
jgi:hypothetical protein